MATPDYGPNFASTPPEYRDMLDQGMRVEIKAAAIEGVRPDVLYSSSAFIGELAARDERFRGWDEAFTRGHQVLHDTIHAYDQRYWRINVQVPHIRLDEALSEDEQVATRRLVEMILWTRVEEEPTGMTTYPQAPTPEGLLEEYRALQLELLAGDISGVVGRDDLPGVTWDGVIDALLSGQVRVGPEEG